MRAGCPALARAVSDPRADANVRMVSARVGARRWRARRRSARCLAGGRVRNERAVRLGARSHGAPVGRWYIDGIARVSAAVRVGQPSRRRRTALDACAVRDGGDCTGRRHRGAVIDPGEHRDDRSLCDMSRCRRRFESHDASRRDLVPDRRSLLRRLVAPAVRVDERRALGLPARADRARTRRTCHVRCVVGADVGAPDCDRCSVVPAHERDASSDGLRADEPAPDARARGAHGCHVDAGGDRFHRELSAECIRRHDGRCPPRAHALQDRVDVVPTRSPARDHGASVRARSRRGGKPRARRGGDDQRTERGHNRCDGIHRGRAGRRRASTWNRDPRVRDGAARNERDRCAACVHRLQRHPPSGRFGRTLAARGDRGAGSTAARRDRTDRRCESTVGAVRVAAPRRRVQPDGPLPRVAGVVRTVHSAISVRCACAAGACRDREGARLRARAVRP